MHLRFQTFFASVDKIKRKFVQKVRQSLTNDKKIIVFKKKAMKIIGVMGKSGFWVSRSKRSGMIDRESLVCKIELFLFQIRSAFEFWLRFIAGCIEGRVSVAGYYNGRLARAKILEPRERLWIFARVWVNKKRNEREKSEEEINKRGSNHMLHKDLLDARSACRPVWPAAAPPCTPTF